MAKMTIGPVTYEGTPEELQAIVMTFPTDDATVPFGLKTEKRPAKVGERILITEAHPGGNQKYSTGAVFTVTREEACSRNDVEVEGQRSFIDYAEYEVIVEPTQSKPAMAAAKPKAAADKLTHNCADYSLVQRKAQPGDVVYVAKDAEGTAAIPNDAKYLVDVDGKIDGFEVYPKYYNRTEANVLVYEKVAVEAPKRFPQYGDIVRVTSDHYNKGFTEGAIGVVVDADSTFSPEIKVCGKRGYARVEIVAEAESRADMR